MKIFDTYPGGKGADGTYQTLINQIPPHNVFISGFLGNCAVTRFKRLACTNIGVDLDTKVIDQWKAQGANKDIDLFNMPFIDYWRLYGFHFNFQDCFVFLDPPYPMAARKSQDKLYDFEMTDADHEQLLSSILAMGCKVMICTYDNPLYLKYLRGWRKMNYQSKTRHGVVTETIYMNYEPEGRLHDYRYIGSDFTDRQRIKRKVQRHVDKLKRLPETERNAILQALGNSFSSIPAGT